MTGNQWSLFKSYLLPRVSSRLVEEGYVIFYVLNAMTLCSFAMEREHKKSLWSGQEDGWNGGMGGKR